MWVISTRPRPPKKNGGGGGGGDRSIIDASKGKLPKIEKDPVVPPMVQTFDKPKIEMPAAIDVQKDIKLPDNPDLPTIGMKSGVNVVLSNGTGRAAAWARAAAAAWVRETVSATGRVGMEYGRRPCAGRRPGFGAGSALPA